MLDTADMVKEGDCGPFNYAGYEVIVCGRLGQRPTMSIEKEPMLIERIPASENWDEWRTDSGLRIHVSSNVLPQHKAFFAITGEYNYSAPLSKGVEASPKAIIAFLRKQTRDLHMFFVVDPPSGRQIFFLNNSKLNDSEVWGRYPYYYTDVKGKRKSCLESYFDANKNESPRGRERLAILPRIFRFGWQKLSMALNQIRCSFWRRDVLLVYDERWIRQ